MEDKGTDLKPKDVDPGWNDPPVFSYESHQAYNRQNKGISSIKRVVFPISSKIESPSGETSNKTPEKFSTPPLGVAPPPPPRGAKKITSSDEIPQCSDKDNAGLVDIPCLEYVMRNFNEALEQSYNQEEEDSLKIKKRLTLMEKMWNENKFNTTIKENIYKLSLALKEKRLDEADSLQRSLMVDHTDVCSAWMTAVRKLIYRRIIKDRI